MAGARTTMQGKGVVITTAGALDVYVQITLENIKGSQTFETEEVKDFEGFDYGWLARNEHVEIDVQAKLTGASKAAAIANGAFMAPLSAVVLSGFDLPWLNAAGVGGKYTGNWQYRSGAGIDLVNTTTGGLTLKLRKYADPTQNTAATTPAA